MTWPFDPLQMFGYQIILADFPWGFENWSEKGEGRNPNRHYQTMTPDDIMALPVGNLASGNCALFAWVVDPLLDRAIDCIRHWGFRYVTVGFTWAKETKRQNGWHMGTGYYTRGNPEMCLIGMMGSLPRLDAGVRQLVVEPLREHSRKPDRIHTDIERLFGDLPRCELFARTRRPGWDAWGLEVDKFAGDVVAGVV